jgi:hypothetical protein
MKICCTCKQERDESCYTKNKNYKDNRSFECKFCAKQYRDSHKKELAEYPSRSPEYREANRAHINKMARLYKAKKRKQAIKAKKKQVADSYDNLKKERLEKKRARLEQRKQKLNDLSVQNQ